MDRVIKLRAWDKYQKKMCWLREFIPEFPYREGCFFINEDSMCHFIYTTSLNLFDTNGVEIFEGDLVTSDIIHMYENEDLLHSPALIEWSEKLACFVLRKDHRIMALSSVLSGWQASVFKVVGNKFEGVKKC